MKFIFISDTHDRHEEVIVPECDILVHCGDWTFHGHRHKVEDFAKWLDKQPAKNIVLIPGNHEVTFGKCLEDTEFDPSSRTWITKFCPRAHILIHETTEIEGIKIFGSPWTPAFGWGWSWNAGRTITESAYIFKPFIGDLWKDIPLDTQMLITHGPPLGIFDETLDFQTGRIENVGCRELMEKIKELKDLKIHAFGHLHLMGCRLLEENGIKYINAAMCDDKYKVHRSPIVVDLP